MRSIRGRLILTLFVLWTSVWGAVAYSTFERSGHEVGELMDAQLAQTANVLRQIALAGHLPELFSGPQPLMPLGHPYESKISFQLWRDGVLIGRFGAAPDEPLGHQQGFSDHLIGDTHWRVFGMPASQPGEVLYVAQSYSIRNELIEYLTLHALRPVLWSLPLSVLLIWMAVTDGLRPLRDLTRDIRLRSSEQLDPIDTRRVPVEINPLAQALNGLMQRLERTLAAERHFAADASHELRTPFTAIRAHAQIALRSQDPEERGNALRQLMRGIDRATQLIAQLLILSRLRDTEARSSIRVASLTKTVLQVEQDKQAAAQAKGIALILRVPPDGPCMVSAAPPVLAILVRNLVENAIKFTPAHGQVVLIVREDPGRVLLQVVDSGRGIPVADRERVFDRFYRPPGQTEAGSGLGLAIVRRICELLGAEIVLRDNPEGTGLLVEVCFRKAL